MNFRRYRSSGGHRGHRRYLPKFSPLCPLSPRREFVKYPNISQILNAARRDGPQRPAATYISDTLTVKMCEGDSNKSNHLGPNLGPNLGPMDSPNLTARPPRNSRKSGLNVSAAKSSYRRRHRWTHFMARLARCSRTS